MNSHGKLLYMITVSSIPDISLCVKSRHMDIYVLSQEYGNDECIVCWELYFARLTILVVKSNHPELFPSLVYNANKKCLHPELPKLLEE